MRTLYLLAPLTLMSCAEQDNFMDIVHDPCEILVVAPAADCTADELASIDDALAMWNTVASARLTREVVAGAATVPIRFESAAPMFFGIYLDEEGHIVVNRKVRDRHERAVVIAHELGHVFGLWHVSGRSSVMNKGNLSTEPNAADAAAVAAEWGACVPRTAAP